MHHRDKAKAVPGPIIVIAVVPAAHNINGIQKQSPTAKVAPRHIDPGVAVDANTNIANSAGAAKPMVPTANKKANAT